MTQLQILSTVSTNTFMSWWAEGGTAHTD